MAENPDTGAWVTTDDLTEDQIRWLSQEQWWSILSLATDILWAATGRRWRGKTLEETVTLRADAPRDGGRPWPYDTSWGFCSCQGGALPAVRARHSSPPKIRLPRSDVTEIVEVTIGGETFTEWRLGGSWLSRTDNRGWPMCGERTQITYRFGRMPPAGGKAACLELAVEMGKYMSERPCTLPKRLQSVTRQGITFAVLDSMDFLKNGLTGVYGVDLWVKSVNPKGRTQAARVLSADIATATRS